MKHIGIVGSRRRVKAADYDLVRRAFLSFYEVGDQIVSGGCPMGGDQFAEKLAKVYQVPITIHYARWDKLGGSAGFIRNGDIAAQSDILIACVAPDRVGGTEDTIEKWLKLHNYTEEGPALDEGKLVVT